MTGTRWSIKKTVLADEQQRPDVAAARQKWRAEQHRLDPERIVFLDETWAKTNMVRSHGRCPKGHRLAGSAPFGHWRTTTFVAGLRHDGIIAPLVMDCPMNGLIFQMYVRECLAPELRPGDTVIMDNLGSHKSQAVRDSIMEQGAYLLFLPPYSPDLNPIENFFSKLKALLRAAKESVLPLLKLGHYFGTERGMKMARKRHSDEDILKLLREIEVKLSAGSDVQSACRGVGVSDATYYNWRKRFGGMGRSRLSEMRSLEKENTRLKRIVAELELDKLILRESLTYLKPRA